MRKIILLIFFILIFIISCNHPNDPDKIEGVTVGEWYYSKEYKKNIIDIINFDDMERIIRVTSLCFDKNNKPLQSNDTEVLNLPPKSQQKWVPICPNSSVYHTIKLEKID